MRLSGSPGPQAPASHPLCVGRVETGPREHRRPCRDRGALLLGAVSVGQTATRSAHQRPDGRTLPQGQAARLASTVTAKRPPYHREYPYAPGPSPLCPLDPTTPHPLGRESGGGNRPGGGNDPDLPRPSAAGLPVVFGPHAPGQSLWRRSARSGVSTCPRHWGVFLQEHRLDAHP